MSFLTLSRSGVAHRSGQTRPAHLGAECREEGEEKTVKLVPVVHFSAHAQALGKGGDTCTPEVSSIGSEDLLGNHPAYGAQIGAI